MDPTYWHRQTANKPIFENTAWSRPENRRQAGKLLIIGGNAHGLTAPGLAYAAAAKAGVGTSHVLLPDAIRKAIGSSFPEGDFAPSTPSGSFGKTALAQFLDDSLWADHVLLAGDFGRNSETAVLLEDFMMRYGGPLTITQDGLDYFLNDPKKIIERPNTLAVATLSQLQKMASAAQPAVLIKHSMSLQALVGVLSGWSDEIRAMLLTNHADQFVLAIDKQVNTTPGKADPGWQVPLSAYSGVWWLQQPKQRFEAITTAIFEFAKN